MNSGFTNNEIRPEAAIVSVSSTLESSLTNNFFSSQESVACGDGPEDNLQQPCTDGHGQTTDTNDKHPFASDVEDVGGVTDHVPHFPNPAPRTINEVGNDAPALAENDGTAMCIPRGRRSNPVMQNRGPGLGNSHQWEVHLPTRHHMRRL
uniref:Uncharacterized protein n=1 Tax=Physcomitrium patens TaxID=3218 RepID=A0A2K1IKE3_PHYPA|nr:hypothetical protein PHYPA_028440 [Physcomitrium patens]